MRSRGKHATLLRSSWCPDAIDDEEDEKVDDDLDEDGDAGGGFNHSKKGEATTCSPSMAPQVRSPILISAGISVSNRGLALQGRENMQYI